MRVHQPLSVCLSLCRCACGGGVCRSAVLCICWPSSPGLFPRSFATVRPAFVVSVLARKKSGTGSLLHRKARNEQAAAQAACLLEQPAGTAQMKRSATGCLPRSDARRMSGALSQRHRPPRQDPSMTGALSRDLAREAHASADSSSSSPGWHCETRGRRPFLSGHSKRHRPPHHAPQRLLGT